MNRLLSTSALGLAIVLQTDVAFAQTQETFESYVASCIQALDFEIYELPDMDCNEGVQFDNANGTPDPDTNDFVLNVRVNDQVDATAACRWLTDDNGERTLFPALGQVGTRVAGVELLIHNRVTGGTCFFAARGGSNTRPGNISASIVSPTNFVSPVRPWEYWEALEYVDANARCVNCHTAGPYIASPLIAPALGRFGLLNNGHDTFANNYHAVGTTGTPFADWNDFIAQNSELDSGCGGCHAVSTSQVPASAVLARHIRLDAHQGGKPSVLEAVSGLMYIPGVYPLHEDYRWMNLDIPTGTGDWESYHSLGQFIPAMTAECVSPTAMEARVVDSEYSLRTDAFNDFLETFNPIDGLACRNSDQDASGCDDYEVQFRCAGQEWPNPSGAWQNSDHPSSGAGDFEFPPPGCSAAELRARPAGQITPQYALPDRLYEFTSNGFACLNAAQQDGQCENYTVRFLCPTEGDSGTIRTIRNAAWPGSWLTTTHPLDENGDEVPNGTRYAKGQYFNQSWPSQKWVLEPVWPTTRWFRIRNVWHRTYLNVETQNEAEHVTSEPLNQQWWSQQWEIIKDNQMVRFRNRWTGKYLTLNSWQEFSDVLSQGNASWTSQRWIVDPPLD